MNISSQDNLYNADFVTALFDEMSKTYGLVNTLSSFGFCFFWRRQCSQLIEFKDGDRIVDLMSGMAELSIHVDRRVSAPQEIVAIDLSPEMNKLARKSVKRKQLANLNIMQGDALATGLADESVDEVVSTFGLKTFSPEQIQELAVEVRRILKPEGKVAFLEISVPKSRLLRMVYMFYLKRLIPLIGRLLMGNADNYRLLGVYTTRFQNCDRAIEAFRQVGLQVEPRSFFMGCATGFCSTRSG